MSSSLRATLDHTQTDMYISITEIVEGSRDGNAKKYSNKGGRDDNKYNEHPYITHTPQLHEDIVMCEMCMYVCDVGMPVVFVIIPTTLVLFGILAVYVHAVGP